MVRVRVKLDLRGWEGEGDVIANLYKHPVKHPLVLYSPELP